jgi:hypothetical protein
MERIMLKKIVLVTLLVGLIGVLVAGGIIRTLDKTGNVAEALGQGFGRGRGERNENLAPTPGQGLGEVNQAEGQGSYGRGRGAGQGNGNAQGSQNEERQYRNNEALPQDWSVVEGTVLQTPEAGGDLVLETDSGEQVKVGTGPGYMAAQGFALQVGERVQIQGYWEDDELKAAQVTRLQDGQSITLRDDSGRPVWAGSGKRAAELQASGPGAGQGQAGGDQGGRGQGSSGVAGYEAAPGDGTGAGQAEVDAWVTLHGTVSTVDSSAMVVQTSGGQEIVVENRAWWFAQEQGFSAQVSDRVTLVGFYEDKDLSTGSGQSFEVGRIENASGAQTVVIREESGRPLWAGRGRRGG